MGILSTSRNTTTLLRTGCDAIRHTSARCFNGLAQFSLAFSSSYLCCAMSWPAKWECENIHDRHDPFQLMTKTYTIKCRLSMTSKLVRLPDIVVVDLLLLNLQFATHTSPRQTNTWYVHNLHPRL